MARTEVTERAYREGVADKQARLADVCERDQCDAAGLQEGMEEATVALHAQASLAAEALTCETFLRAHAAREIAERVL